MAVYSGTEIKAYCLAHGFTDDQAETMAAIALAESGGNNGAHALTSKEDRYGVYQINRYAWPMYTVNCLRDMYCSTNAAYTISRQGTDFTPWSVYKDGKYKSKLPIGKPAPLITDDPGADLGSGHTAAPSGGLSLPDGDTIKRAALNLAIGGAAITVALLSLSALFAQSRAGKIVIGGATKAATGGVL